MIDKYSEKVRAVALAPVRKSLCVEISSTVIFHGRELNLMSNCR